MLFAGENVIPVVHEGDATGVQVAIMLGRVVFASDVDSVLAEGVDDNGGLSAGPILKVAVPGSRFRHCALPKLIISRSNSGHWWPVCSSSRARGLGCNLRRSHCDGLIHVDRVNLGSKIGLWLREGARSRQVRARWTIWSRWPRPGPGLRWPERGPSSPDGRALMMP